MQPDHEHQLGRVLALPVKLHRGLEEHGRLLFQSLGLACMLLPGGLCPKHVAPVDQEPIDAQLLKGFVVTGNRGCIRRVLSQDRHGLSGLPGLRSIEPLLILDSDEGTSEVICIQHTVVWARMLPGRVRSP